MADNVDMYSPGGVPSNGQTIGVSAGDARASADNPIPEGVTQLFRVEKGQFTLSYGLNVNVPASTYDLTTGYPPIFEFKEDGCDVATILAPSTLSVTVVGGAETLIPSVGVSDGRANYYLDNGLGDEHFVFFDGESGLWKHGNQYAKSVAPDNGEFTPPSIGWSLVTGAANNVPSWVTYSWDLGFINGRFNGALNLLPNSGNGIAGTFQINSRSEDPDLHVTAYAIVVNVDSPVKVTSDEVADPYAIMSTP